MYNTGLDAVWAVLSGLGVFERFLGCPHGPLQFVRFDPFHSVSVKKL